MDQSFCPTNLTKNYAKKKKKKKLRQTKLKTSLDGVDIVSQPNEEHEEPGGNAFASRASRSLQSNSRIKSLRH